MSITALMTHTLTIRRLESPTMIAGTPPKPALDSWGHPAVLVAGSPPTMRAPGYGDVATVKGLVQERTAKEIQGPQLQGVVVSDSIIFLPLGTDVTTQDRIRRDNDLEYDVQSVRDAAGHGHHLELDARRIQA
jgi:hypothetical protein